MHNYLQKPLTRRYHNFDSQTPQHTALHCFPFQSMIWIQGIYLTIDTAQHQVQYMMAVFHVPCANCIDMYQLTSCLQSATSTAKSYSFQVVCRVGIQGLEETMQK